MLQLVNEVAPHPIRTSWPGGRLRQLETGRLAAVLVDLLLQCRPCGVDPLQVADDRWHGRERAVAVDRPAGDEVDGPFSAYCEAMVIDKHALEATGGLRYAELDREDPKRQTAMTASFLQASLFTSVVAFGVAAMAIAIGVLFILIGLGIRDVANRIRDLASRTPASP